jgi:excisionase family DNA binding protein
MERAGAFRRPYGFPIARGESGGTTPRNPLRHKGENMENNTETPERVSIQIIAPAYYFKEILTIKEASEYIGVSVGGIHQYVYNNKIPCHKPIGARGNTYFKKSELDEFMLQNKKLADYEAARKAAAILNGEDL